MPARWNGSATLGRTVSRRRPNACRDLSRSTTTRSVLDALEAALAREASGPVGSIIPVPQPPTRRAGGRREGHRRERRARRERAERTGATHHDRSGPDRRPDAVDVFQQPLRQLVLPPVAGVRALRPQYLCAAVLRPGKAVAADGTLGVLSRLLPLLRCAFPRARFLVRFDGGFATPEIFDFLDAEPRLGYVVAMAKNAVLLRHAASAMVEARAKSAQDDQTAHVYTDTRCYRAGTWDPKRRVVIKADRPYELLQVLGEPVALRVFLDRPMRSRTQCGRPPSTAST